MSYNYKQHQTQEATEELVTKCEKNFTEKLHIFEQ